ncbi:MAG: EamA family transporter [Sphingobacteriales bacterium]|nr:EamA family transporter [Sphingobacteriales bacterium]
MSAPPTAVWCCGAVFSACASTNCFFIKGLSLTSPINAALLMISTPILVLILATLINKERLGWQKITGIAMGQAEQF